MLDKIRLIYNKIENRVDEICDDGFVLKKNQQEYETLTDLEDFINSFPKEPASEDLIEEIDKIWKTCNPIDEGMGVETANIHIEQFDDIARHFAEWQKNQMKEVLQTEYEKGRFDMQQEMMKDAVIAWVNTYESVTNPYDNEVSFITNLSPSKFKNRETVKIIIVEEEQQ